MRQIEIFYFGCKYKKLLGYFLEKYLKMGFTAVGGFLSYIFNLYKIYHFLKIAPSTKLFLSLLNYQTKNPVLNKLKNTSL